MISDRHTSQANRRMLVHAGWQMEKGWRVQFACWKVILIIYGMVFGNRK